MPVIIQRSLDNSSRVYIFKLTPTCCNSCFDLVPGNVWLSHLINSTWNAVAKNQHIFLICISYCITVRFIACKSWYFWKCLIFRTSPRSLRLEMYFKLALFEFCRTFFESLSSLLPFFLPKSGLFLEAVVWRFSLKKGFHKNFAKFTRKHLCWSHFLIKLLSWRSAA